MQESYGSGSRKRCIKPKSYSKYVEATGAYKALKLLYVEIGDLCLFVYKYYILHQDMVNECLKVPRTPKQNARAKL